jgi:hypothetical protein
LAVDGVFGWIFAVVIAVWTEEMMEGNATIHE